MAIWRVSPAGSNKSRGTIFMGDWSAMCALGASGCVDESAKREGDGKTPFGRYPIRYGLYRDDRVTLPTTKLRFQPMTPMSGWCDDIESDKYNSLVEKPFSPSHEVLWREDHVYDVLLVLGHNDDPVVPDLGSAIFMHLARPALEPTRGCIAVEKAAMFEFLQKVGIDDLVEIAPIG